MKLSEFPPELMRLVTEWAGSSSVLNLWLSGDLGMIQLMGHRGGVNVMRLEDRMALSTSRWPMVLGQMKGLEILAISRGIRGSQPLYCASLVFQELQQMRQLRVLHLMCSDAEKILFGGLKERNTENLKNIFPRLEELRITDLSTPLDSHGLPDSLRHLRFQCFWDLQTQWAPPNGIETLELGEHPISVVLPSSLTSLAIPLLSNVAQSYLPKSLTSLQATVSSKDEIDQGFSLPLSLTHLDLSSFEPLCLASLRHLTRLKTLKLIHRGSYTSALAAQSQVAPFPLSLTSLQVSWPFHHLPVVVPPRLQYMEIEWKRIPCSIFTERFEGEKPYFPSDALQLASFVLPNLSTFTDPWLPSTLKSCILKKQPDMEDMGEFPSWLLMFPCATLTKLDMGFHCIDDALWALMPPMPHLESISLRLKETVLPAFINDSPRLRSAKFDLERSLIPGAWKTLPEGIEKLEVAFFNLKTKDPRPAWPQPFHGLPRNQLKVLQFFNVWRCIIWPEDATELAKLDRLEILDLDFSLHPSFKDDHLNLIPRSLTSLYIRTTTSMSSECFQWLPPKLTFLSLLSIRMTSIADAKYLPRTLRQMKLANTALSPHSIPNLPACLSTSNLFPKLIHSLDFVIDQLPDPRIKAGNPMVLYGDLPEEAENRNYCVIS